MAEDLPIYSDIPLRTGLQFAELERLKGIDLSTILDRADAAISALEGAAGATAARQELHTASKNEFLQCIVSSSPTATAPVRFEARLSAALSWAGLRAAGIHRSLAR
jgi:hypothetical protein